MRELLGRLFLTEQWPDYRVSLGSAVGQRFVSYLTPIIYNKLPSHFKANANLKVCNEFFNADVGMEDLDHYLLNYNTFVAFSLLCGF